MLTKKHSINIYVYIGFVLGIILVIAIGILTTFQLGQIRQNLYDLTGRLASNRALAHDILNQVSLTRFTMNRFIRTRLQGDLDQFRYEFNQLENYLLQAEQELQNTERLEMLSHMKPLVQEYGTAFERVVFLIRRRQQIHFEILDAEDLVISNKLTALRVHALSIDNAKVFLAFANAKSAFQVMNLNAARYIEQGDERYPVLFDTAYEQAKDAFAILESIVVDPTQYQNIQEVEQALTAYYEGLHTIRTGYMEQKQIFGTQLDVLEPEINRIAENIASSIEREFTTQNLRLQSLIIQTQLVLVSFIVVAAVTGLGLGWVMERRMAERNRAAAELQASRDHLEDVVAERTVELRHANEMLKLENSERVRAEKTLQQHTDNLEAIVVQRTNELETAHERLIRREKLAVLGRMAGSLGHELRNPLGVISNTIYLLKMLLADKNEDAGDYLDLISTELKTADNIISDLLDFSRTRQANREGVSVTYLVNGVLLRHPPPENVQVKIDIPEQMQDAYIDAHQISLVLNNLVTNAYEAMPDGGTLTFTAHLSSITSEPADDDDIVLDITDTGCGILPENIKNLFEPLFTTKTRGIGLGLALSKNLVELNEGTIQVTSVENQGTTFTIRLKTVK
ncbi:MAG: ATP-binding protein [Anaerolineae bacterium]|nr:ATP-binding protein [Anaerolineae bacterium]